MKKIRQKTFCSFFNRYEDVFIYVLETEPNKLCFCNGCDFFGTSEQCQQCTDDAVKKFLKENDE